MLDITKREAVKQLWERAVLWYKLDSTQKELYFTFQNSAARTVVWLASRRLGKSFALCVIAIEQCLKFPNSIVKYVAPQQKMVKTIIRPILREILEDCPEKQRPKYFTQDNVWRFPNGSEIQLAGTDSGNAENLRGGNAHLCIVDEAGFCQDLEYLVSSILLPTMITTNGKIILSSTPPISSDHAFIDYMNTAKIKGSFVKKTIYDNPRLSKEQIEAYIEEDGGIDHPTVRRELLCEIIIDAQRAVLPEFTEEIQKATIKAWPRPSHYDCYAAMDIGHNDLTFILFAYYDFKNDKLIIEDEFSINGPEMTTNKVAEAIQIKEKMLWKDPFGSGFHEPFLRVSDNNLIMINDLQRLHNLTFVPTDKSDADGALNQVRMMISAKKIIIHPRCKDLISHMQNATWNRSRKSYERAKDDRQRWHHYDAVDALKYLIRNVSWAKNPYPPGYNIPKGDRYVNKDITEALNPFEQAVKQIYTVKSSTHRKRY